MPDSRMGVTSGGRVYEDRSGVDDSAQYRCTAADNLGSARPCVARKGIAPHRIRGAEGRLGAPAWRQRDRQEWLCNIRRCPMCRGEVEKVEAKQGSTVHAPGCTCGFREAGLRSKVCGVPELVAGGLTVNQERETSVAGSSPAPTAIKGGSVHGIAVL